jgi:hypothetical protein
MKEVLVAPLKTMSAIKMGRSFLCSGRGEAMANSQTKEIENLLG